MSWTKFPRDRCPIRLTDKMEREKAYEYAAIALTLLAIIYLTLFLYNAYYTFHEYNDLAGFAYDLYFNMHYPQIAHGLQFIVIGNHISPDMLLIMPIFALYPSSSTLLIIQLLFVYCSGFLVFYISKDLIKDSKIALILTIAFLIFPGTLGMVIFDAHIEFPITLFFLLSFYYYMKRKPLLFVTFSLLLIGSSEVAPILGAGLGISLLIYEYRHNKEDGIIKNMKIFAVALIVLSLVATVFYAYVNSALTQAYASGQYPGLNSFAYITGPQNSLGSSVIKFLHNPVSTIKSDISLYSSYLFYAVYALLLVLFSFGIAVYFSPEITFFLLIPWLSGVLIFQDTAFLLPFSEYFSFVISPLVCASILGIMLSKEKYNFLSRILMKRKINVKVAIAYSMIIGSMLFSLFAPLVYLYAISPVSKFHSINTSELKQLLFFYSTPNQTEDYAHLYSLINMVPNNASLLTEYFIMAHMTNRRNLDFVPNRTLGEFVPEYILVDFNRNISNNVCNQGFENCTAFQDFYNNGNYTLYAKNGTAMLYKRK